MFLSGVSWRSGWVCAVGPTLSSVASSSMGCRVAVRWIASQDGVRFPPWALHVFAGGGGLAHISSSSATFGNGGSPGAAGRRDRYPSDGGRSLDPPPRADPPGNYTYPLQLL